MLYRAVLSSLLVFFLFAGNGWGQTKILDPAPPGSDRDLKKSARPYATDSKEQPRSDAKEFPALEKREKNPREIGTIKPDTSKVRQKKSPKPLVAKPHSLKKSQLKLEDRVQLKTEAEDKAYEISRSQIGYPAPEKSKPLKSLGEEPQGISKMPVSTEDYEDEDGEKVNYKQKTLKYLKKQKQKKEEDD
jgi:hypothetical protein